MKTSIKMWGNSAALRIPNNLLKEMNFEVGQEVDISIVDGNLTIRPVKKNRYCLDDLLAQITPENRHPLIDFGAPVGLEIISYDPTQQPQHT